MTIFERMEQQNGKEVGNSNQPWGMAYELVIALIRLELIPLSHESLNGRKLQVWKTAYGVSLRVIHDGISWPQLNVAVGAEAEHDRVTVHCDYWIDNGVEPKATVSLVNDFNAVQYGVFVAEFRTTVFGMLNAYTKGEVYEPKPQAT